MIRSNKAVANFTMSKILRCRWNVFDLITIVAKNAVPAYLFCQIDMQAAEKLRARFASHGIKVTVTPMILKAISIAQISHPKSRSIRLPGGKLVTFPNPIAGFTVERMVGENPAVFFGTIDDPVSKSIGEMARELKSYAEDDIPDVTQLRREDLFRRVPWIFRRLLLWFAMRVPALRRAMNPATFGLSTLGKFGLQSLLGPCVSPCIFGVGAVEMRAVPISDRIEVRPMLTLSLSADLRVLNEFDAARLLSATKMILESGLSGYISEDEFRCHAVLS